MRSSIESDPRPSGPQACCHRWTALQRPIVTLYGLWNRGPEGWLLRHRLSRLTGNPVNQFHYRTVSAPFEDNVAALLRFVETIPERPIDLVGHSLGGLVALAALSSLPPGTVRRVVLLGPPVTGSRAVRNVVSMGKTGRLIVGRNSDVLVAGFQHAPPPGVEIGVIAGTGGVGVGRLVTRFPGRNDGTVAVDETRLPSATDHIVLKVTHTGMLFSGEVAHQTAFFLSGGRFDHPERVG
ncbi:MAG: alpha/beta fold hydrolase [Gammaproteobacteria bacterium]|nr:MAG: alpha/beta fold hydrolase [Gammaproteobacteria bacterium]